MISLWMMMNPSIGVYFENIKDILKRLKYLEIVYWMGNDFNVFPRTLITIGMKASRRYDPFLHTNWKVNSKVPEVDTLEEEEVLIAHWAQDPKYKREDQGMKTIFDKTHLYAEYPNPPTAITFLTYFIILLCTAGWIMKGKGKVLIKVKSRSKEL